MGILNKHELETYAKLCLDMAIPAYSKNLRKGESPDWQDEENGIGVEVSCAESNHIGYVKSFANQYLGKDIAEIPSNRLANFKGYTIFDEHHKLSVLSANQGLVDGQQHINLALETAKAKLSLLNENYRIFRTNGLFLFVVASMTNDDCEAFIKQYSLISSGFPVRFDYIFLMDLSSVICIDADKQTYVRYNFSEEDLAKLDQMSHGKV